MIKKILLPTDFSNNAWNAIFTALKLFAEIRCEFYLLHAYEPEAMNMLGRKGQQRLGTIYDSLSQYSARELKDTLAYLNERHTNPNHSFETLSKSETLLEAIEETLAAKDIDLVVMGTQGASGAKDIFMGSNTVTVLKKVTACTVLAVPAGYDFQRLKVLAFSTDFMDAYDKLELLPLIELAKLWQCNIHIVHVGTEFALNETQKANQHILKERLASFAYSFQNIPFEANVSHSLATYFSQTDVDMLAMIRYHHTFWEKLIGEPIVKKIAYHSHIPMLMLPEH